MADAVQGLRHAYIWQDGTITDLGTLEDDPQSEAWDINNLGQVVGMSFQPGARGVLWENGQVIDLGTLGGETSAHAINETGQIVGSSQLSGAETHAFLWQNSNIADLGTIAGPYSFAWDINELGQVVGESSTGGAPGGAFLWQQGTMTNLGNLGAGASEAFGINDNTQVVGSAQHTPGDKFYHAFLWDNGTMTDLIGDRSQAEAINNAGQIVGSPAFLYDPQQGALDLHDLIPPGSGWSSLSPRDINDAGQIVGVGTINGNRHAMLMEPVPPPIPAARGWVVAVLAVALVIGGALVVFRRTPAAG